MLTCLRSEPRHTNSDRPSQAPSRGNFRRRRQFHPRPSWPQSSFDHTVPFPGRGSCHCLVSWCHHPCQNTPGVSDVCCKLGVCLGGRNKPETDLIWSNLHLIFKVFHKPGKILHILQLSVRKRVCMTNRTCTVQFLRRLGHTLSETIHTTVIITFTLWIS